MTVLDWKESDGRLVWVDIETTGLDKETDVLLEVCFKITDLDLNVKSRFHSLIWMDNYLDKWGNVIEVVREMHTKNKLINEAHERGSAIQIAESHLLEWLLRHDIGADDPLCGSSVQFDRDWLTYLMPNCMRFFSHRNIDVSTVKELCRRFNPTLFEKLEEDVKPKKLHRADPDIMDTIEEFRWYRDNFLWVA